MINACIEILGAHTNTWKCLFGQKYSSRQKQQQVSPPMSWWLVGRWWCWWRCRPQATMAPPLFSAQTTANNSHRIFYLPPTTATKISYCVPISQRSQPTQSQGTKINLFEEENSPVEQFATSSNPGVTAILPVLLLVLVIVIFASDSYSGHTSSIVSPEKECVRLRQCSLALKANWLWSLTRSTARRWTGSLEKIAAFSYGLAPPVVVPQHQHYPLPKQATIHFTIIFFTLLFH